MIFTLGLYRAYPTPLLRPRAGGDPSFGLGQPWIPVRENYSRPGRRKNNIGRNTLVDLVQNS